MQKSHEELEERFNWCCLLCERYTPISSEEEQKVIPNCLDYGILSHNNSVEEDRLREEKFRECDERNNYSRKAA